jgi:hypothetical protein
MMIPTAASNFGSQNQSSIQDDTTIFFLQLSSLLFKTLGGIFMWGVVLPPCMFPFWDILVKNQLSTFPLRTAKIYNWVTITESAKMRDNPILGRKIP